MCSGHRMPRREVAAALAGDSCFERLACKLRNCLALRGSYRGGTLADLGRNAERDLWRVSSLSRERRTPSRAPDLLNDLPGELGGESLPTSEPDVFALEVDVGTKRRLSCHPWGALFAHEGVPFW